MNQAIHFDLVKQHNYMATTSLGGTFLATFIGATVGGYVALLLSNAGYH